MGGARSSKMRLGGTHALLLSVAASVCACGGQSSLYKGNIHSSSAVYAGTNALVGAVIYVAAGGCKISGCPTNTQCNRVSERCDPVRCGDYDCKGGETCNEKLGQCVPVLLGGQTAAAASAPPVPTPINASPNALP